LPASEKHAHEGEADPDRLVFERGSLAPIGGRRESLGICRSLRGGVRPSPAANVGMELFAVLTTDPIVHRLAVL